MKFWLIKSEPGNYSWQQFLKDGKTSWDGVRNYQARNNIQAMSPGDQCVFYHSTDGKEAVGIAEVISHSYPDPKDTEGRWSAIDMKPFKTLDRPVSLAEMKSDDILMNIALIRQTQLSVMPVEEHAFNRLLELSERKG